MLPQSKKQTSCKISRNIRMVFKKKKKCLRMIFFSRNILWYSWKYNAIIILHRESILNLEEIL